MEKLPRKHNQQPTPPDKLKAALPMLASEAMYWHLAAKRLGEKQIPVDVQGTQGWISLANQTVVCNAFSIELYLKALLIHFGKEPDYEHDAHYHFLELPPHARDVASNNYKGITGGYVPLETYLKENGMRFVSSGPNRDYAAIAWKNVR